MIEKNIWHQVGQIMVEWKQTVKGDFFRYQTVTTAWCSFRFWVEWLLFKLSSPTWWREKSIFIWGFHLSQKKIEKKKGPRLLVTSFCKKMKIFFSRHQMALESLNYNHSTQNRKLHQAVVTVWYRKKSPLTVCFHSTITTLPWVLKFKLMRLGFLLLLWFVCKVGKQPKKNHLG